MKNTKQVNRFTLPLTLTTLSSLTLLCLSLILTYNAPVIDWAGDIVGFTEESLIKFPPFMMFTLFIMVSNVAFLFMAVRYDILKKRSN